MSHTARSLFKNSFISIVILTGCSIIGCSLFDVKPSASSRMERITKQKVYFASYDSVWRAAHTTLKYPISVDNQDSGVIETELIKALDGWQAPDQKKPPSRGIRYKIIFTFAKGKTDGRESTRLTIDKKIEILKDFFSDPEPLNSDGLEEAVLFYRIERELILSEALKKAN